MFKQICKTNYTQVKEFVNMYKFKTSVNSILDCNTKGTVFADDINNISLALIWDNRELLYVFGEINDLKAFNENFKNFLNEYISATGILISFFPEEKGGLLSKQIIEEDYLLKCFRWTSELNLHLYNDFKRRYTKRTADDIFLCKISKSILETSQACKINNDILDYWENTEDFVNKGFGFCLIKGTDIISSIISCSVTDEKHIELSINTYEEQFRNKGFATHCAVSFIDYCLQNKLIPVWETDYDNIESQNLGLKLGFLGSVNENRYQFRLNRANNYLINLYCHLKDSKLNTDYISKIINKVLENNNSDINPKYLLTIASMLAEHKMENQIFLLLEKYLEIDGTKFEDLNNNTTFQSLKLNVKWEILYKKYSNM